jgi:O-antigen/teichoic acid export membrane protein
MPSLSFKVFAYAFSPSVAHPLLKKIEASDVGSRLARGVFWSMAGSVISRGLMLCATVLVARILGKTVYGELGLLQSTVGMFGTFAGFGLGLTATKHVAEFRQCDPVRAGRIIGLSGMFALLTGGVMALGLFYFAPWLAEYTINAPHLVGVLRIGALLLLINALNGAQTGALSGFEAFKTIAYVNLFVGLLSFPILVCGAYFGRLTGAAWALVINLGVNWLLNHFALRKEVRRFRIPFIWRGCFQEWSVLWRFSLPAVISGTLVGPVRWACNAMMVNKPNGYGEMGLFTAALVFQQLLLFANRMLNAPLLSMLSNYGPNKNKQLESVNILSSWLLGLLTALPFLCFPEIIEVFFGAGYVGSSFRITFVVVVFYTCILTYRSGLLRVLQSKSLLWWGVGNNLLWAVVLLPSAFLLVKWGAVGLAISFAIAYVSTSIVFVPVYMKYGKVSRGLIFSKEVLVVWLVVIILVSTTFFNTPILYRALALPLAIGVIALAMKNIWLTNAK